MNELSARVVHINDNVPESIYIGRAMPRQGLKASPLANPYKIGRDGDRITVCGLYDRRLAELIALGNPVIIEALIACRDRDVACWCRRVGEERTCENWCHGDSIVFALERYTDAELRALATRHPSDVTAPAATGSEGGSDHA